MAIEPFKSFQCTGCRAKLSLRKNSHAVYVVDENGKKRPDYYCVLCEMMGADYELIPTTLRRFSQVKNESYHK